MVFSKTFNSFSYSMAIEVRIVIISIGKRQEVKQICKLYCIIEGDEWLGKNSMKRLAAHQAAGRVAAGGSRVRR